MWNLAKWVYTRSTHIYNNMYMLCLCVCIYVVFLYIPWTRNWVNCVIEHFLPSSETPKLAFYTHYLHFKRIVPKTGSSPTILFLFGQKWVIRCSTQLSQCFGGQSFRLCLCHHIVCIYILGEWEHIRKVRRAQWQVIAWK